jgi:hypothetical protein
LRYIDAVLIPKSLRRFVAQIAILALLFGQIMTAAYACPVQGLAAAPAAAHATAHAGLGPCGGMDQGPADTQANACEVHCTDGIADSAQPDLPPVVLAALPVAALALAEPGMGTAGHEASISPLSGAPPVALRFCRLLI